jgi:dienelactone hydrolase
MVNRWLLVVSLVGSCGVVKAAEDRVLPGTEPLEVQTDLAMDMLAGIDRYLDRALAASAKQRSTSWKSAPSEPEAYEHWLELRRQRLRRIIGAVDPRRPEPALEYVSTAERRALVGHGNNFEIYAVRWPVLDEVDAEGLMLDPKAAPAAFVVALPDADVTPEQLVGLMPGVPPVAQFARRLAESGCQALIPTLIDRADNWSGHPDVRFTNQPHREFIYRPAYQMGRHIIGYEVQKVLAAVDWFQREAPEGEPGVGVIGYGEGGLLALYSAAVDPRIRATVVSGYFRPREQLWREPIYRNVWSLLRDFGDAELLCMIAPRLAIVEASAHPHVTGPPPARDGRRGAAPGVIETPPLEKVRQEFERARRLAPQTTEGLHLIETAEGQGPPGSPGTLERFLKGLGAPAGLRPPGQAPETTGPLPDPAERLKRQFDQLNEFTQHRVRTSPAVRQRFWAKADASSAARWQESTQPYREYLWNEVIGPLPKATRPPRPRTRLIYDEPGWRGYEVVLDVYPDVFACGILLVPGDIEPGQRRPVVVCQHGLEGRARDTIVTEGPAFEPYQAFARRLVERGFVVYAPQNPYLGGDRFRMLQRKANPLKLSLYSFIVRQHEQTLNWLSSLPFVDPGRIGFYGLSYGGRTALMVCPLLDRYALAICSANFNDWIEKTTSLTFPFSYLYTGEYEMPDFDLGQTFNHAELAGLIAPRPFMVERGHRDAVATDQQVAREYARVRECYARLGIPERTEIEFFDGGHQIHGEGTFAFLHRHLAWPSPSK